MKPCMRCEHATAFGCKIEPRCDKPDLPAHPLTPLRHHAQIEVKSASAASGTMPARRPGFVDDDAPTGSAEWERGN